MYCSAHSYVNGNQYSGSFWLHVRAAAQTDPAHRPVPVISHITFSSPVFLLSLLVSCYVAGKKKKEKKWEKAAQNAPKAAQSPERYLLRPVRSFELDLPSVIDLWDGTRLSVVAVVPAPQIFSLQMLPWGILHFLGGVPGPPGWEVFVYPCQWFTEWTFCAALENKPSLLLWSPHLCLDSQLPLWQWGFLQYWVWGQQPAFLACACFPLPKDTWVGICSCWLCTQTGHSLMGRLSLTRPDAVKCHRCLNEALVGSPPWFPSFQEDILANYLQNVPLN